MPDNLSGLSGEATQLLSQAGQGAQDNANREADIQKQGVEAGSKAGANLSAERQQKMSGDQAQQLATLKNKLDQAQNMMSITPQIALGLVRATGEKEWLKAIGQKQPAQVVLAQLRYGISTKIAGKEFKTIKDGKEYTIANDIDENGDPQPRIVAIGDAPVEKTGADTPRAKADRASREKVATARAASGGGKRDPKDTEFEKTYRQYQKDTEGMNGALSQQLAKKDPKQASDMQAKIDFLQKNQDRFNQLQGTSSGSGAPAGDNQKEIDYLKKNYPQLTNPTPQDIEWAKGKLGG